MRIKENKERKRKNEQKIKKTTAKTFLKESLNPLRGEINPAEPYNLLI